MRARRRRTLKERPHSCTTHRQTRPLCSGREYLSNHCTCTHSNGSWGVIVPEAGSQSTLKPEKPCAAALAKPWTLLLRSNAWPHPHHHVLRQAVIDEGRGVRPYFPHPRQELRRVAAHMHKSGEANRLPVHTVVRRTGTRISSAVSSTPPFATSPLHA